MKTQMMAAGLLLAISSLGLAAEQCKVQSAFQGKNVYSAAIDSSRNTIYFTDDWGADKIQALNLGSGETEVLDLGAEWKYRIQSIATGTGSYIYAVGNYQATKEDKVDEDGRTNTYSAVFKIAKHDGEVVDVLKLWQRYYDGDESGFGSVQLDQGDDRLYVALEDEGDFGAIEVINTNTMKTMKDESKRLTKNINKGIDKADIWNLDGMALDDEQGVIYKAGQGVLLAFGTEGQDADSFELALSGHSPALAYDRNANSLLMSYGNDESQAIVGRISLEGEIIASLVIEELSQSRSGISEIFPTADEDKILVLGYQGTDIDNYSGVLLEVDFKTGTAQALCE